MYRILTASADNVITDKIVNNSFRATDANVGQAGTLDLFKLYDESTLSGSQNPIEVSRILIKFDLDPLRQLTGSSLNLNSSDFKCFLHLSDVYGGQTTPTNFTAVIFPLSKSFDEGFGRDIGLFQDLDSSNFITASSRSGISAWNVTGANGLGLLGSTNIDIIGSGTLDVAAGVVNLSVTQVFNSGEEDLYVDITRIVSATLVGLLPDCGLRISYSGSQETDDQTRFVKRFSSRHSMNPRKRPKIRALWNDTLFDDHADFSFDLTGSLFLNNFQRGALANLVSGTSLTQITGTNALLVRLMSGSFTSSYTASQHRQGSNFTSGIYSATFVIPSNTAALRSEILAAGSATFTEIWSSLDGTVPFLTSTLEVFSLNRTGFSMFPGQWIVNITNMRSSYRTFEKARLRVFVQNVLPTDDYKAFKLPFEQKSKVIRELYYRVKDAHTLDVIVPFDRVYQSTRLSIDSDGMYFDLFMDTLEKGRVYQVDLLSVEGGVEQVHLGVGGRFRVEE